MEMEKVSSLWDKVFRKLISIHDAETPAKFLSDFKTKILHLNSSSPWYMRPVNRISIGSDNGLSPIRRQAII